MLLMSAFLDVSSTRKHPIAWSSRNSIPATGPLQPTDLLPATELTQEAFSQEPSDPCQPQRPTQASPVSNLLIPNSSECSYYAHHVFTSLPDETDTKEGSSACNILLWMMNSPEEELDPVIEHVYHDVCEVCGITTLCLNNGGCSWSDCLSLFRLQNESKDKKDSILNKTLTTFFHLQKLARPLSQLVTFCHKRFLSLIV